ncbi:hypothetical protein J2S55_002006 [Streptosporangium brasiliense]|uniref:Uncharacterized protein n=1 Tax=Streptosporangium brasiliense TaxID=47480 RepID=A0ABT9R0J9_9ACTN|nr:hypothetical protein [Streptosporangium brasiliense]
MTARRTAVARTRPVTGTAGDRTPYGGGPHAAGDGAGW